MDGAQLESVSEFKYLRCVLDTDIGTAGAKYYRKVVSKRKVVGAIRFLVNTWGLQLECARVLHEAMLMHVPFYGSETMAWKVKERYRIKSVQLDNLTKSVGY